MSKNDVFYRRSFHSDRDLRGVESMLELDQPLFGRKSNANKRVHPNSDAGFEAPRNSLDVSIGGLLDLRRQGQVIRAEDIPIGYELSRSLTSNGSRRRSEDFPTVNPLSRSDDSDHYHLKAKSMAARLHLEPGSQSKPRTSVVARLMGLDPLPSQESGHGSSRLLPQDAFSSQHGPSIAKQNSFYPSLSVSMADSSNGDSLSYGELPFRKHPQEKQLEEFKREFASRHALRSAGSKTTTMMKKKTKKASADDAQETLSDVNPEEFLDTLDFLRANQEFFSRVLNDPDSVFAKHLPRRSSSSSAAAGKDGRAEGGNLMRSFSESRKDYHDLMMLPGPRKPEMGRYDRRDSICAENYDANHRLRHQIDSNSAANMADYFDRPVPTRIVVLKPNVGKHATFSRPCSSSSSSPSPHTEGLSIIKTRVKDGKENNLLKQMKAKSSSSKNQIRQDAKDIARRIIEQATKEETRPHFLEPMGRRQRAACGDGDGGGGISDGEAPHLSSSSNRKVRRETGKMYSSLPSSPRLHRIEAEDEHNRAMMNSSIVRKGPAKGAMAQTPAPVKISKETLRGDGYGAESSAKRRIRKERQKSKDSAELRIDASPSPKVLPRSLSAPTVNRTSSEECAAQQEPTDQHPAKPKPKPKPKPNEISVLKGRLLSLKESLLSSKKNTTKKKDRSPSPSPVLEITTDSVLEQQTNACEIDDGKEASHALLLTATSSHWDETSLLLTPDDDDSKESSTDHSVNDALSSDNGMTPKGLRRWVSAATDFTDHNPEANADKCEQPSPISVLEVLPYQEESPISDIKHEDLLHLEHFPVYNNNNDSVDDDDDGGLFVAQSQVSDNSPDEGLPCGWTSATAITCDDAMAEWTYIRDILIFGGFTEDGFVMKHAFSPDHGIDPSVFERLEDHYYKMMMKKNALPPETGIFVAVPLHLETRRVLFDAVDEILSVQLKKNPTRDDVSSWFHRRQPEVTNVLFFYTGKRLLEHIWAQLSYYRRFAESEALDEKALEDIATKDLSKECPWVHSDIDVQSVASELERLICGDLIREFVHDYRRRK